MGKMIRKTGFLGFGKPIEEFYCDKCGVRMKESFYDEAPLYCAKCADILGLPGSHSWTPFNIEYFNDTRDGIEKHVASCNRCFGLTIHTKMQSGVIQVYYQVGHKEPQQKDFDCVHYEMSYINGHVKSQVECHHSWVTVATSKTLNEEANKKYEKLMQNRNYMIEHMFGADEIDIQYHCFGATHYWCRKCGLYRNLNPQREHLLPIAGV